MFIDFTRCKKYPKSIECAKVWVKFTQGVKRIKITQQVLDVQFWLR